MIIKCSKHKINNANQGKINFLDKMFINYKHDLIIYINYIIDGFLPLKELLSSKNLPSEKITHSRYKSLIYKQASFIVRSQLDKAKNKRFNKYKKIYSYMKEKHPNSLFVNKKFSELKLNNILKTKYFTIPNINNISINLDERFFDIKSGKHFDSFVKIILPFFNEKGTRAIKINLPLNNHKHSNNLEKNNFKLRKNIQIKFINNQYYIYLIWSKEKPKKKLKSKVLGIDMGFNNFITTSNKEIYNGDLPKIYNNITRKKQGSKSFKKCLTHRDNEINRICNSLQLDDVSDLIIEDLKNVKLGKKYFNNKIQRWSYNKTIFKLQDICDVNGINMVKVLPSYTSQTCSSCGHVDKNSRNKKDFLCTSCGYSIDADINASINILNRGIYSFSNQKSSL